MASRPFMVALDAGSSPAAVTNQNKNMEINARIRFDGRNRLLVYTADIVANHVPLYDPHVNIKEQVEMLDLAHKAIESAIEEINSRLVQETMSSKD